MNLSKVFNNNFGLIVIILIGSLLITITLQINTVDRVNNGENNLDNSIQDNKNNNKTQNKRTLLDFSNPDKIYHCFKKDSEKTVVEEIYLSDKYFLQIYNYDSRLISFFDGEKLYEEVHDSDCDFIIKEYDNIYENFKLNLEQNWDSYDCSIIDYNNEIFNQDMISNSCSDYFNIYDIEVLGNES